MQDQPGTLNSLLPCPFCYSKNLEVTMAPLISKDFQDFTLYENCVRCLECGSNGPVLAYVENVRVSWNVAVRKG